jgi:hypothetical protein
MRNDMAKIIVERPRGGRSWADTGRGKYKLDPDLKQIGVKKAVKIRGPYKSLNENLSPLKRYLMRQVGRPWDKVWSEICANLKPDSTVQQHVRDHIPDFVAIKTVLREGEVWIVQDGTPFPLKKYPCMLYVHPKSGLLLRKRNCASSRTLRKAEQAARDAEVDQRRRIVDATRQYHLLNDGAWWEVTLAPIPFSLELIRSKHAQ